MAIAQAHRYGQLIGKLLEEIMTPLFQGFCDSRGLYLDKKGVRGKARSGKKVTWEDKYGNSHDLDFVIEKGGTSDVRGRPLAFIEAAWRRYTKHSRNKAQEIQGAVLPIAEKHLWDKPFLGIILAGEFTSGSLTQMQTSGFATVLFPYNSIVNAFKSVGIDAAYEEKTSSKAVEQKIKKITMLTPERRNEVKKSLQKSNKELLDDFFKRLGVCLDRQIDSIVLIALHGDECKFSTVGQAKEFINRYPEAARSKAQFKKFEVIVRYNNDDFIDGSFADKQNAISFLEYVEHSGMTIK